MKRINLVNSNKKVLVDDEDFELLNKEKWYLSDTGYAVNRSHGGRKGKYTIRMHRIIIKAKTNELVDHVDCNPLNNQKSNLRISNKSINGLNRKNICNITIYRNKYRARVCIEGNEKLIGYYLTLEEAREAKKIFLQGYLSSL